MNDRHDEFRAWSGAYVLGALSVQDRYAFEAHLRECPGCAVSVQELAGLPGLLATVPAEVAEAQPVGPVPDTLLPRLIREVRRRERRRRWLVGGVAAGVAAAVSVGALTLSGPPEPGQVATQPSAGSSQPAGRPSASRSMAVVGDTALRAVVALEQVAWGTRLDLSCTYPPTQPTASGSPYRRDGDEAGAWPAYELVVRSRTGATQQVATWKAVPGKTITLTGATSWAPSQIASVQVRTTSGRPLLELEG
ncbi:MAG TPA: zf-HC2 domain-containing protein [Segeticoccus sp.]|nr:zf-HC2 domain-containing protein [Segeticoccus sp.]